MCGIIDAAMKCLPLKRPKNNKPVVRDSKTSKIAWNKWQDGRCPLSSELAEEKKIAMKRACQFVAFARAKLERSFPP